VVQNKTNSDDGIVSLLDCVEENFAEVESNDSDTEIGVNQDSYHRSARSGCEQSGVPQWHDFHIRYHRNTLCMCTRAKKKNIITFFHMGIGDLNPHTVGLVARF
jgi:hypothetical protein